jgi:Fe2+ transport system protein FeoA
MAKSESGTQEWTLATAPAGHPVEVVAVGDQEPSVLLVHGIRPGARLVIDGDAPLGGPRIVRLGTTRIAIDRRLAATIRVDGAPAGAGRP